MRFLNLVVQYDPNPESLYARVNWQRTAVAPADCWEFQFNLLDNLEDQQEQTDGGFSHFMPTVGVYFPRSDIQELYERLVNERIEPLL